MLFQWTTGFSARTNNKQSSTNSANLTITRRRSFFRRGFFVFRIRNSIAEKKTANGIPENQFHRAFALCDVKRRVLVNPSKVIVHCPFSVLFEAPVPLFHLFLCCRTWRLQYPVRRARLTSKLAKTRIEPFLNDRRKRTMAETRYSPDILPETGNFHSHFIIIIPSNIPSHTRNGDEMGRSRFKFNTSPQSFASKRFEKRARKRNTRVFFPPHWRFIIWFFFTFIFC